MLNTIKDNLLLKKESLKSRLFSSYKSPLADRLIRHLGLKDVERVIHGKPDALIVLTKDSVIRMPLDRLSAVRCRVNSRALKALMRTSIAEFVPDVLEGGIFEGRLYYREERLSGVAIDLPLSKMDEMVVKAADFITKFHQETARDIVINDANFKRLFGREFTRLYPYLNDDYREKLARIEDKVKKAVIGKPLKTVWFHGDYKIENVLFDTKTWQIKGIIDWDLSRKVGLPLLDIFYLLAYKETLAKKSVVDVFTERFSKQDFTAFEKEIIEKHITSLAISTEFIEPLVVMFWINHVGLRYGIRPVEDKPAKSEWINKNVYDVINVILARS